MNSRLENATEENTSTENPSFSLLRDIRSRGARNLKGMVYLEIQTNQKYKILRGYSGRTRSPSTKAYNSYFDIQYLDIGDQTRIRVKEGHANDLRQDTLTKPISKEYEEIAIPDGSDQGILVFKPK